MEPLNLREVKDSLQSYYVPCEDNGKELERSPYAKTVEQTLRGLRCVGKQVFPVLYQQDPHKYTKKFIEECRSIANLHHPNIVQFLGVCFSSNVPTIVTEHLTMTLGASLDKFYTLPAPLSYSILTDVALALRYLHEKIKPVIHRDLHASNILLTESFTAKISDLGIAKMADAPISKASRLTKVPGTLCYMAPEALVTNPKYNTSNNIFSYGILVLHVFTAQWPLPTEATKLDPNLQDQLIPVSEWERRQEFVDLMGKTHPLMSLTKSCLSNNPSLRPKAIDVWKSVTDVSCSNRINGSDKLHLLSKLEPRMGTLTPSTPSKKMEMEPRVSYENQPRKSSIKEQPTASTTMDTESNFSYENQPWKSLVREKLVGLGPDIPERGKIMPSIPEREKSHRNLPEKYKSTPNIATKKPSEVKKDSFISNPSIDESKERTGRLSSSFATKIFEVSTEKAEKKTDEFEHNKQSRKDSGTGESVSKLKMMFSAINEESSSSSSPLPTTAPKPTKDRRWRRKEEIETRITNQATKNGEQESQISEDDSYVDMTPKVLENESKVRIFAQVIYNYNAEDEDELSIVKGDMVEVVDIQDQGDQPQWWLVRVN